MVTIITTTMITMINIPPLAAFYAVVTIPGTVSLLFLFRAAILDHAEISARATMGKVMGDSHDFRCAIS